MSGYLITGVPHNIQKKTYSTSEYQNRTMVNNTPNNAPKFGPLPYSVSPSIPEIPKPQPSYAYLSKNERLAHTIWNVKSRNDELENRAENAEMEKFIYREFQTTQKDLNTKIIKENLKNIFKTTNPEASTEAPKTGRGSRGGPGSYKTKGNLPPYEEKK